MLQDAPFFTVKLNVKVLPCVIMFSTGVAVDRVAGFDDFGAKDDFTTDSGGSPTAQCIGHGLHLPMIRHRGESARAASLCHIVWESCCMSEGLAES